MKKKSTAARVAYADQIIDDILDSADNPLNGKKWWQASDDPWQTLATCIEIAKAIRSKDHTKFISHLPIHQDGSCNGLQHYAALGRDIDGAKQVNLTPMDLPQDVYSGVAELVELQRKTDAENGLKIAKTLDGHIQRKVVKQTVMTVVYGVTRYGARLQILKQLVDLKEFPKQHANTGALYLVSRTFKSLDQMFSATRVIQSWFDKCAKLISSNLKEPVIWTTPLGLPVVQPYFQSVQLASEMIDHGTKKKMLNMVSVTPDSMKQVNGFAPNFVHSLDSTHMMLTAIHAQAAGICFVSVHDCYWTHANTVEIMNRICREQFVALHSEPILQNLSEQFLSTYCKDKKDNKLVEKARQSFTQIPARGEFELKDVLNSEYFFS